MWPIIFSTAWSACVAILLLLLLREKAKVDRLREQNSQLRLQMTSMVQVPRRPRKKPPHPGTHAEEVSDEEFEVYRQKIEQSLPPCPHPIKM